MRKNPFLYFTVGVFLFLGFGLIVSSCDHPSTEATLSKPITPTGLDSSEVDTAFITQVPEGLTVTGKVAFNEDKIIKIFPLVSGPVRKINVEVGDYVAKGQVLAEIFSSEIAGIEKDYLQATSEYQLAQRNLEIAKDMQVNGIYSLRDVSQAKKDFDLASVELNRTLKVKKLYGASPSSLYIIRAPISGYIVEKNATEGTEIRTDNNQNLFTIGSLEQVWVIAHVYESDIHSVDLGNLASVTPLAYPEKTFKGSVSKIYNLIDPDSRTESIRISLDNTDLLLKPEMFVTVQLTNQGSKQNGIRVSKSAIIFDKDQHYVVLIGTDGKKQITRVDLLKTLGNDCFIKPSKSIPLGCYILKENSLLVFNALKQ